MKCTTCKQDLPAFQPGDLVESRVWGKHSVGVIPSVAVLEAINADGRWTSNATGVGFIDLHTGAYCWRLRMDVRKIHGYIHIDRPPTATPAYVPGDTDRELWAAIHKR